MKKLIGLAAIALFGSVSMVASAQPPSGGYEAAGYPGGYVAPCLGCVPRPYNVSDSYKEQSGSYRNTERVTETRTPYTYYTPETHYHYGTRPVTKCTTCGPVTVWEGFSYPHTVNVPHTGYDYQKRTERTSERQDREWGYTRRPGYSKDFSGDSHNNYRETIIEGPSRWPLSY